MRQRRPREKDEAHLTWLRQLPCLVCGKQDVEAAHVRFAAREWGKRETGKGERPSDYWAVPLCSTHHRNQHGEGERLWWGAIGLDPVPIASALHHATGDDEMGLAICEAARRRR